MINLCEEDRNDYQGRGVSENGTQGPEVRLSDVNCQVEV